MTRSPPRIRHHLPFIIIMPLLIIVMTWPTIAYVFDSATFAVPTRNIDVGQKLWDIWHGGQFLAGRTSFYHSEAMFYPVGVSLAFENFSLPHMIAVGLLGAVLPTANAYSLTYLLIVFAAASSAYIYLNYLFRDRWLALAGASVFGLSQHVTAHGAHPDVNLIVSLPLSVYFFQRAIEEERVKHLLYCGITVGFSAFMSIYIFICALISLALISLYYAMVRWRDFRYWRWMFLLVLAIGICSAARILPMLADGAALESALSKSATDERGTDLLSYFVNYWHPVTSPLLKALFQASSPFESPHTSYLGYLPLALIIIGFFKPSCRRKMLPWLALALPFLLLRLGSVLTIDGEEFGHIALPKSLLADLIPPIFSPFHAPDHFQMGVLLPLAVMTGYGLKLVLGARPESQRALITIAVIAVIAFEYYESTAMRIIPDEQFAFIKWLRQEAADQEPRLINLPMGRHRSKLYVLYQTLTGYPQVEGLTGRTAASAYAYIEGNFLLEAWRSAKGIHCFPARQSMYIAGLDQLVKDGFTHVIWHHWLRADEAIASSFVDAPLAYGDDYVSIYRVEDLRQNCDLSYSLSPSVLLPLRRLETSPAIVPQEGAAILSILSDRQAHDDIGAAVLFGLHSYSSLALADGQVVARQSPAEEGPAFAELLANNSVILLAYNPRTANADAIDGYRAWLAPRFKLCRRLTETDDATVEYFFDAGFPCYLALADRPLAVHYANGIQLGNLLLDIDEGYLDLYLLWTRLPDDAHAFSIQFIEADGERAAGQDFVIGLEPLAYHRIDTSSLPAGDYRVQMILYDYATGKSVSGAETASGSSFERALEIARLPIIQPGGSE